MNKRRLTVIGITGGIASGKSTLLGYFQSAGVPGIDCDRIVHQMLRRGTRVYSEIVAVFGEGYLDRRGELDRRRLGRTVFSDRSARRKLERIVHPAVFASIARQTVAYRRRGYRVIAVDIPLLFETRSARGVDVIAVAYVPRAVQVRRLRQRGWTVSEALARIRAQWSLDWKRRHADKVFDMRRSLRQIRWEVRQWVRKMK